MIAADRRQARTVMRYIVGLLDGCPMLARMVVNRTAEAVELSNGIVIEVHTASFRAVRGYTVVVPTDASLAATDYEVAIGQFQILNQNSANATNEPLKSNASTLSRTDLIAFQ